ncbi:MAG: hypothetical protein O6758_03230, partial [Planctomycetota bacterium]|nr:hypothetical protein [Planctomycetota bacterium]
MQSMCKKAGPKRFTMYWFAALVVALSFSAGAAVDPDSPVADALTRADLAVERIVSVASEQRSFDNTVEAIDDLIAQLELDTNMT